VVKRTLFGQKPQIREDPLKNSLRRINKGEHWAKAPTHFISLNRLKPSYLGIFPVWIYPDKY